MDLDSLFESVGWRRARRDKNKSYYIPDEIVAGFCPTLALEDGDYSLAEIVSLITYTAYLEGLKESDKALSVALHKI